MAGVSAASVARGGGGAGGGGSSVRPGVRVHEGSRGMGRKGQEAGAVRGMRRGRAAKVV